jgi:hypothetical protein
MVSASHSSSYSDLVLRLSRASVTKHFDAYADVPWEDASHVLDPEDPRFILDAADPLGATDWYRNLPDATRARMGLHLAVSKFKVGIEFERVLQRGLLELADRFDEGRPELRYVYHEVIEESQHSLMFQEIVHRSGLEPFGMGWYDRIAARGVPRLARTFPELFFIHVLGGEVPIDGFQRKELERSDLHPLFRRIMQIHVLEEARHVAFANAYLREHVRRLGFVRRTHLRIATPIVLWGTAKTMLEPPRRLLERYHVPEAVIRGAYRKNPAHRARLAESIATIRETAIDLGIVTRRTSALWKKLGIWA